MKTPNAYDKLENALKYFSGIADLQDAPVGITVTDSGNFVVNHSLSNYVVAVKSLADAAEYIVQQHTKELENV